MLQKQFFPRFLFSPRFLFLWMIWACFGWLAGFPPAAQAQSLGPRFELKEGVENTFSASGLIRNFQFVTEDESGLYLLHLINRLEGLKGFYDYYIERYDPVTLAKTDSELLLTGMTSDMLTSSYLLTCRKHGGEVWCLFMENEGNLGVYAQRLDLSSLQLTDERVDLLHEEGRKWNQNDSYGYDGNYFLPVLVTFERDSRGRDRAVVLIKNDKKGGPKGEAYYTFVVYDEHLKELWSGASALEDRAESFMLDGMILRPDQNELYLLSHRRLSENVKWEEDFYRKEGKEVKNIFWELTGHSARGEVWHIPIDTEEDPVFSNLNLAQHPDKDEFVLWAKYRRSPKPNALLLRGIFLGHFDLAKREFSLRKYTDLKPDQAADLLWGSKSRIERAYEKDKRFKGLDGKITNSILREDGGLFLEFYTSYRWPGGNPDAKSYQDLAGVPTGTAYMAVSPTGEIEWIHKTVVKSRGLFSSFACSLHSMAWFREGRLYFLFTVVEKMPLALFPQKLPEINIFYLSASDGEISEVSALKLDREDEGLLFSDISKAIRLGDDELLLWVSRKSEPEKFRWIRLRYKWIRKKSRL